MELTIDLLTMLWSSLAILIFIVAIRILIWRLGIAPAIKLLTNMFLLGLTIIPALILYLMKSPDELPWILIFDPPLFYDLGYAFGYFDLVTAVTGVFTFALVVFLITFLYLLPSPCVGEEQAVRQCIIEMYRRPSWIIAIPASYIATITLGLGIIHIQMALFQINPLYVILPLIIVIISLYLIIRSATKIITLPATPEKQSAPQT